jgi:hypothetical protein
MANLYYSQLQDIIMTDDSTIKVLADILKDL